MLIKKENTPAPPVTSNHPWSRVLIKPILVFILKLIKGKVDTGTKNHINEKKEFLGPNVLFLKKDLLDILKEIHPPIKITTIASSLKYKGRYKDILKFSILYCKKAPPKIVIMLRNIIGKVDFTSSSKI
jgi:hypothetical protein